MKCWKIEKAKNFNQTIKRKEKVLPRNFKLFPIIVNCKKYKCNFEILSLVKNKIQQLFINIHTSYTVVTYIKFLYRIRSPCKENAFGFAL